MIFIDEFLRQKQLSEPRERHYRVLQRALHRFELYQRLTGKKSYKFSFDTDKACDKIGKRSVAV